MQSTAGCGFTANEYQALAHCAPKVSVGLANSRQYTNTEIDTLYVRSAALDPLF